MQAGEAHLAGVKHLLNSRHERQSDAVAKLDMIESKFFDFAEHRVTGGVPSRIPAGGERKHAGFTGRRPVLARARPQEHL